MDGILDFLSLRIKISCCLPVCDAPRWPTCWVGCEMCILVTLTLLSPHCTRLHSPPAGSSGSPHLFNSAHHCCPTYLLTLFIYLFFSFSFSLRPFIELSLCCYSASTSMPHLAGCYFEGECSFFWCHPSRHILLFILLNPKRSAQFPDCEVALTDISHLCSV